MSEGLKNTYTVYYYASMREKRGLGQETLVSSSQTPRELFAELDRKFHFGCSFDALKVAVNDEYVTWDVQLKTHDGVIFIPPVSGG